MASRRTRRAVIACARPTARPSLPIAANLLDRNFAAEEPYRVWGRHHRHSDWRGLALPGRDPRPVRPESGRLGDAGPQARRTRDRRFDQGPPAPPPRAGPEPPFGSRQPACRRRLPQDPAGRHHHATHEPRGKLPGQPPRESFFGTPKTELVHHRDHPARDAARRDPFAYIEGCCNRPRSHAAIGSLTPQQADRKTP